MYFHETHAVNEWRERLPVKEKSDTIAACHDENVAQAAKAAGFKEIFYAKKSDTAGLIKTVQQAVDFAKSPERIASRK